MRALKACEVFVRFQKRLLHEIRRVAFGPQAPPKLRFRQETQILPIAIEQII